MELAQILSEEPEMTTITTSSGKVIIAFIEKDKMPNPAYYGCVNFKERTILMRKGLRHRIKRFVLAHEMFHVDDPIFTSSSPFVRELRANFFTAIKHPIDFLYVFFSSIFIKERRDLYIDRFINNY